MEIVRREKDGVVFYACDGFSGTAHGFSTRLGGVSPAPWDSMNLGALRGDPEENVAENYRRFCSAIGADAGALVKNHQVHSARVRAVTRADCLASPDTPGEVEADGLVTDEPGVCLVIFTGDCVPVLLYEPERRVAAAVHAGWRGTAAGIAREAALRMQRDYGARPECIRAAIGPSIGPCCFETHEDVPQALEAALGTQARACFRVLPETGKYAVDIKRANVLWLLRAGLCTRHIALSPLCTACRGQEFWSHRRLGARRGSMAAFLQIL